MLEFLDPGEDDLERCGCGFCNGMVLLSRSAADTNRANDLLVLLQRNATRKKKWTPKPGQRLK